jgi:hypothetical protein
MRMVNTLVVTATYLKKKVRVQTLRNPLNITAAVDKASAYLMNKGKHGCHLSYCQIGAGDRCKVMITYNNAISQ